MSDPVDLDHLDKLYAAATAGEWRRFDTGTLAGVAAGALPADRCYIVPHDPVSRVCYANIGTPASSPNLNAIVALHNSYPALRARIRELEAECERMKALYRCAKETVSCYDDGDIECANFRSVDAVEIIFRDLRNAVADEDLAQSAKEPR
jgi:hypothetical protein